VFLYNSDFKAYLCFRSRFCFCLCFFASLFILIFKFCIFMFVCFSDCVFLFIYALFKFYFYSDFHVLYFFCFVFSLILILKFIFLCFYKFCIYSGFYSLYFCISCFSLCFYVLHKCFYLFCLQTFLLPNKTQINRQFAPFILCSFLFFISSLNSRLFKIALLKIKNIFFDHFLY